MKPDPEATEFDADGESNAEGESESADEDKDEDVRPNRPVRVVDEEDGEEEMSEPEHDFVDETEEEDKDKDGASTEKAGKRAYDSASDSDSDSRSGVLSKSSKRPKLAATPPRVHPRSAPIGAPPTPQSPHMKNLNHLSKHQHQPQPQYLDLQALAKQALQEPPASRPLDMPLPLTQSTLAFMESVNNHFKLGAARQSVEPPRVQAPAAIPESQSTILASSSRTSEPEAARDPNSVAPNAATPQQAAVAHAQRPYHCEAGTCRLCHAVTHMLHWVHTLAIFRCEDE
jgi:hypothetical protein